MPDLTMEVIGWTGGVLLICAYAMVSFERLSARGAVFQGLNLAGSLMVGANAAWHWAWPLTAVNVIWIGVGFGAFIRMRRASP